MSECCVELLPQLFGINRQELLVLRPQVLRNFYYIFTARELLKNYGSITTDVVNNNESCEVFWCESKIFCMTHIKNPFWHSVGFSITVNKTSVSFSFLTSILLLTF